MPGNIWCFSKYVLDLVSFVSLICLPMISNGKHYRILHTKSNILCKFTISMIYFSQGISFFVLLSCSIERCLSILMPLESRMWTTKNALVVIMCIILWNILCCIPHILIFDLYYFLDINKMNCYPRGRKDIVAIYDFYHALFHPLE